MVKRFSVNKQNEFSSNHPISSLISNLVPNQSLCISTVRGQTVVIGRNTSYADTLIYTTIISAARYLHIVIVIIDVRNYIMIASYMFKDWFMLIMGMLSYVQQYIACFTFLFSSFNYFQLYFTFFLHISSFLDKRNYGLSKIKYCFQIKSTDVIVPPWLVPHAVLLLFSTDMTKPIMAKLQWYWRRESWIVNVCFLH